MSQTGDFRFCAHSGGQRLPIFFWKRVMCGVRQYRVNPVNLWLSMFFLRKCVNCVKIKISIKFLFFVVFIWNFNTICEMQNEKTSILQKFYNFHFLHIFLQFSVFERFCKKCCKYLIFTDNLSFISLLNAEFILENFLLVTKFAIFASKFIYSGFKKM